MMRKVKVKGPKKSSTLKRMNINLYGDKVTAPKLELPTAQFGDQIIGGTSQPDPGNIRSTTKTLALERAEYQYSDLTAGEKIKWGLAGATAPALEWLGADSLGDKWEAKAVEAGAGKVFNAGSAVGEFGSAVGKFFTGDYQGMAGDIAEGTGDIVEARGYGQAKKGNWDKSEKLLAAGKTIEDIGGTVAGSSSMGYNNMGKGMKGMTGGKGSNNKAIDSATSGVGSLEEGGGEFMDISGGGGMGFAARGGDIGGTGEFGSLFSFNHGGRVPIEMKHLPKEGKVIYGNTHSEGGEYVSDKNNLVAEVEDGEVLTEDGIVYSDTTINPETGKPFSKDAKKLIKSKDNSKEGETTRRLAEKELYIKQEKAKEEQGLENIGETGMKKYKKGGSFMYGKKLNLPKMQGGDKIPQDKNYLRDLAKLGDLAKKDGIFRPMSGDGTINYEPGVPTLQKDIFSATEKGISGDPKLKTLGERFFRNADGSLNYNNKKLRGGEKKDGKEEEEEGGKGNLTPGDKTQLAGNMIPPLANLAAMKSIRENTVDYGKDRSIIRDQKISTADMERTARQEGAATRAGLTAIGSDSMKSTVSANTTKAIQDAQLEAARINTQSAMTKDQLEMQKSQFNVKQEDLTKLDRQDRRDLATTTGLTAAEQTGKALVDLGLTENQSTTNATQLKILKEAFPDYTIDADNMKAFVRKLASNGDITRFKINPEN